MDHTYKYFLDFGTHRGEGLKMVRSLENFGPDVKIYSFEANPVTFSQIPREEDVEYHNVAVSNVNGFLKFNCEEEEADNFTGGGSTLLDLSTWNPESVYKWKPGSRYDKYTQVNVVSLSIVDLLHTLLGGQLTEKSIVAKFDVEGSEYSIFEALEATDNFKWFSKIYVEFHALLFENKCPAKLDSYWMDYFEEQDIEAILWM